MVPNSRHGIFRYLTSASTSASQIISRLVSRLVSQVKDAENDAAGMSRVYANITARIATVLIPGDVSANIYTQTSDVETEADGTKTSSFSR